MANRKAVETLGMPQGTASNRLRKMLLFRQLKKHGENICVRCNKEIEFVEELSVEHIKPWEGISAKLFWDLDNVAFSHLKCNVPHIRHGWKHLRKTGDEGTSWCSNCQIFHPEDFFSKDSTRWNGLRAVCREQMKKYKEGYFEKLGSVGPAATTPLS
jgi:HNH endonuclease